METEQKLEELLYQISTTQQAYTDTAQAAEQVNKQIESLRAELSKLQGEQSSLKVKRQSLNRQRESVERELELERKAEETRQQIELLKKEAESIREAAAWGKTIYEWQFEGAVKLASAKRGLLADKRGLGKTLSSIAWRRLVGSKRTLIATKKNYVENFIKELGKWDPGLTVIPLVSPTESQRKVMIPILQQHTEELVVITNIETWRRNIEETINDFLSIGFDSIILDEAHHIKKSTTATARGFRLLSDPNNISNVLELTGTPFRNKPQELFSLLHSLYPDMFVKEKKFLYDYCEPVVDALGMKIPNRYRFSKYGLQRLFDKIGGFYVGRSPDDVGHKIPPPDVKTYYLDFDGYEDQWEAYKIITERQLAVLKRSDKVLPIASQLAVMTRQRQMTAWPAGIVFAIKDYETGEVVENIKFDVYQSAKVDWSEDFIKELVDEGERVVLFSFFKPPIYELQERLEKAGIPVAVVTGDTNKKLIRPVLDDFDLDSTPENPRWKVLLCTYGTFGESVNLNAAKHGILFDRFWNPASDDQATGRLDRLNNLERATIHLPAMKNTIDIYMESLIREKETLNTQFKSAADIQQGLFKNLEASLK